MKRKRECALEGQETNVLKASNNKINDDPLNSKKRKLLRQTSDKKPFNTDETSCSILEPKKHISSIKGSRINSVVSKTGKKNKSLKIKKVKNISSSSGETIERVKWKKIKDHKKNLKILRKEKKKKNHFEIIQESKKIWEEMRTSNCPELRKMELVQQLLKLLHGQVSKMMRSHDTTRIIQWIIKIGSDDVKERIVHEILSDLVTFAQCKYASHTVTCILMHANQQTRSRVVDIFCSNILKLLFSKHALPIVEKIYSKFANKNDKLKIKRSLYGTFYKSGSTEQVHCLSDIFSANQEMKTSVLSNVKSTLDKLLDKPKAFKSSLVHDVLNDYISLSSEERKKEILESLQPRIKELIGSKEGASVARTIIWNASTKVKKSIVKCLNEDLKSIAVNEHGSGVLLTLIDSVDDTVLMKKAVIPNIITHAEDIASNKHGRKVLLYLVAHRNPTFFNPWELSILKEADNFTKKDCSLRIKELLEALLDPLTSKIEHNTSFWLHDSKILVTYAVLKKALDDGKDLSNIYGNIADFVVNEKNVFNEGEKTYSIVEHPGLHMVLKKIILLDKNNGTKYPGSCFSVILEEKINDEVLKKWILLNRGCFLLISLVKVDAVFLSLKEKLCKSKIRKLLCDQSSKGAILLRKTLT